MFTWRQGLRGGLPRERFSPLALIGYARVSTAEQDTALQTDALRKADCERVFEDAASGAKADRPGFADALAYLRDGEVLTVWRLDRLGRSMPHLIETIGALGARGVGSRSLTEAIDTTTPGVAAHLPRIRRAGPVRARLDPRAYQGRVDRRRSWAQRRAQTCCHCRQVAASAGVHRQWLEHPGGRSTTQGEQNGSVRCNAIHQCGRFPKMTTTSRTASLP
jgi:hypothetical protein